MQEIFTNITAPAWWFSTVIAALAINLISSYGKNWIDRTLSKVSRKWVQRTVNSRQEFQRETERLVMSPHSLRQASENEVRYRLQAILVLLIAVICLLSMTILSRNISLTVNDVFSSRWWMASAIKFVSLAVTILGMVLHNEANRQSDLVRNARRILVSQEG
jgi:hypothetical protein